MPYNWQLQDWPAFQYNLDDLQEATSRFSESLGHVSGILKALPKGPQTQSVIDMMVVEAIKTSAIEGETLSRQDVLSSIRNNLGLNTAPEQVRDKRASGAARLMVNVRETFAEPLREETLFAWHEMIMEGSRDIHAGQWRTHEAPMQIISGPFGRETVHFEAPPSSRVPKEMEQFIQWFNATGPEGPSFIASPLIRSAVSHLYFESIHPFEDGNGRIGRALAEKTLSQGIGRPILLSLSKTIEANRATYYDALKTAQRSNEITSWIEYFINTILEAQREAESMIEFTLIKTRFFDRYAELLNARQEKVLRRMLDEDPDGFEGGMSAKKYMSIAKTSKATATRDMQQLMEWGIFVPLGEGRSRRYEVRI
ncbi:MAG: Fic family protein [Lewinellaceae bacterium]|nr:Fic family protein [Lewinellaceae bacterium]